MKAHIFLIIIPNFGFKFTILWKVQWKMYKLLVHTNFDFLNRGGYNKVMFQGGPTHMKQDVVLSILTPFSSKSAKRFEGAAQKTELDEGVQGGGLKITILCYYLSFVPF